MKVVLFYRKGDRISRLIAWFTWGKYSHAAILMQDGTLYESMQGVGVRRRMFSYGAERNDAAFFQPREISPSQVLGIKTWLESQLGKPYDYWAIVRFITRQDGDDKKRWFCSELVFQAFRMVGINLLARIEAWKVSPTMLSYSPELA